MIAVKCSRRHDQRTVVGDGLIDTLAGGHQQLGIDGDITDGGIDGDIIDGDISDGGINDRGINDRGINDRDINDGGVNDGDWLTYDTIVRHHVKSIKHRGGNNHFLNVIVLRCGTTTFK